MRKLETLQKENKLNEIYATDEKGNGGAHHKYKVVDINPEDDHYALAHIHFQNGPRHEENSEHGVLDLDLLEIVKDRLTDFQNGPYKNDYNLIALKHVEEAITALNQRVVDRANRGVLGKNEV